MKMKKYPTKVYFDESITPLSIRIVSEKLCLDHTFFPNSSHKKIKLNDILTLQSSPFIDSLSIEFAKNSAFIKSFEKGGGTSIDDYSGWLDMSEILLKDIAQLQNN